METRRNEEAAWVAGWASFLNKERGDTSVRRGEKGVEVQNLKTGNRTFCVP